MIVYSHRGESKYAPENTMSAFYLADFVNSDGIETDIRKTKDNELVLIHDKTIDRTSSSSGKVSDYTYEELLNFDFGNKKYKGEKIVNLKDFLKYFSNKDTNIYLEIKESGYEKEIIDTILPYNIKNITLISFKYEILKELRELSNSISLGWLVYDVDKKTLQESSQIKLNQMMCIALSLNRENVQKIKDNNFISAAWGVKNKAEIRRMEKIGVDRIIYDSGYDVKKVLESKDE